MGYIILGVFAAVCAVGWLSYWVGSAALAK